MRVVLDAAINNILADVATSGVGRYTHAAFVLGGGRFHTHIYAHAGHQAPGQSPWRAWIARVRSHALPLVSERR